MSRTDLQIHITHIGYHNSIIIETSGILMLPQICGTGADP